jgi:predicted  nucleic acid-binding Zn-ribbon protein
MATTPGVGQDIEALCGKCGQVWHVVMAKMGERIAKVVCKRCGGHHRYRNENEEAADEAGRSARGAQGTAAGTTQGTTAARAASRARKASPLPSVPAFDPTKPARPYAAGASYAPGERIAHPSFGVGVVAGSPGAGKIDVVFPSGPRVLAAAKAISSLARPIAATHVPIADRPPK